MRVKILLHQITGDDGAPGGTEEIATFGKSVEGAEDLGLPRSSKQSSPHHPRNAA